MAAEAGCFERLSADKRSCRVSDGHPRDERLGEGGYQRQPLRRVRHAVGPARTAGDQQLLEASEPYPVACEQVGERHPGAAREVARRLAPRHLRVGYLRPRGDHPRGQRLDQPSSRPLHL